MTTTDDDDDDDDDGRHTLNLYYYDDREIPTGFSLRFSKVSPVAKYG